MQCRHWHENTGSFPVLEDWYEDKKMNNMWEMYLKSKENIRFHQAEIFSPYYEQIPICFQNPLKNTVEMEVNGFYRYETIFAPLFENADVMKDDITEYIFDIFMHYLMEVDLKSGMTKEEYHIRKKMQQLNSGEYGQEAKKIYLLLTKEQKYQTGRFLLTQEKVGASVELFAKALVHITGMGVVYKNKVTPEKLLFYTGKEEQSCLKQIISFIEHLFLPFNYTLRIFWQEHFGVVGKTNTMELGYIELF